METQSPAVKRGLSSHDENACALSATKRRRSILKGAIQKDALVQLTGPNSTPTTTRKSALKSNRQTRRVSFAATRFVRMFDADDMDDVSASPPPAAPVALSRPSSLLEEEEAQAAPRAETPKVSDTIEETVEEHESDMESTSVASLDAADIEKAIEEALEQAAEKEMSAVKPLAEVDAERTWVTPFALAAAPGVSLDRIKADEEMDMEMTWVNPNVMRAAKQQEKEEEDKQEEVDMEITAVTALPIAVAGGDEMDVEHEQDMEMTAVSQLPIAVAPKEEEEEQEQDMEMTSVSQLPLAITPAQEEHEQDMEMTSVFQLPIAIASAQEEHEQEHEQDMEMTAVTQLRIAPAQEEQQQVQDMEMTAVTALTSLSSAVPATPKQAEKDDSAVDSGEADMELTSVTALSVKAVEEDDSEEAEMELTSVPPVEHAAEEEEEEEADMELTALTAISKNYIEASTPQSAGSSSPEESDDMDVTADRSYMEQAAYMSHAGAATPVRASVRNRASQAFASLLRTPVRTPLRGSMGGYHLQRTMTPLQQRTPARVDAESIGSLLEKTNLEQFLVEANISFYDKIAAHNAPRETVMVPIAPQVESLAEFGSVHLAHAPELRVYEEACEALQRQSETASAQVSECEDAINTRKPEWLVVFEGATDEDVQEFRGLFAHLKHSSRLQARDAWYDVRAGDLGRLRDTLAATAEQLEADVALFGKASAQLDELMHELPLYEQSLRKAIDERVVERERLESVPRDIAYVSKFFSVRVEGSKVTVPFFAFRAQRRFSVTFDVDYADVEAKGLTADVSVEYGDEACAPFGFAILLL